MKINARPNKKENVSGVWVLMEGMDYDEPLVG